MYINQAMRQLDSEKIHEINDQGSTHPSKAQSFENHM